MPSQQSSLGVATAATPKANTACSASSSSPPIHKGTPPPRSSAPDHRGTPPLPSSAPAHMGTPSPPASAPSRSGYPPSPRNGSYSSPSPDVRTPSPSHGGDSSSSSGPTHVPGGGTTASGGSSKLYVSPSPDVRTPSPSPGGDSSSSGPGKSYASLLHSPQKVNSDNKLRSQLLDFLNNFTNRSAKIAYYKSQVTAMKMEGSFKLGIQFEHLLRYNKDMAIAICNGQTRIDELVHPAACQFLSDEKLVDNRSEIAEKMEVKFFSMPQSIKPVTDFIQENGGTLVRTEILAGRFNECVARDIGMMVVQRSIAEVFRAHAADLTWDGAFDITDFVVINDEEIRITKEPVPGEAAHRAHDLHRIGFIYMPFFTENGRMALYFSVLHHDLINAGENDIMEEWFREYILYHTALRPSAARYSLVTGVHQTCQKFGAVGSAIHQFLAGKLACYLDWRSRVPQNTADVFSKVYWFKFKPTEGVPQPFEPTNGGILAYKRHFFQHADIYLNVQDLCEVEKIGARRFEKVLPYILKLLLRDCDMHKSGPLLVYWKSFRDLRVSKDGSSDLNGRIGFYITFW